MAVSVLAALTVSLPSLPAATNGTEIVKIAGVLLSIPRPYFIVASPMPPAKASVLLKAFLPSLSAVPTDTNKLGWGAGVLILISPGPAMLNIHYASLAQNREGDRLDEPYGLESFFTAPGKGRFGKRDEVFFAHSSDEITTLIICFPDKASPGCEQHFQVENLDVELTYGMGHLKEWQAIESGIRKMIREFKAR